MDLLLRVWSNREDCKVERARRNLFAKGASPTLTITSVDIAVKDTVIAAEQIINACICTVHSKSVRSYFVAVVLLERNITLAGKFLNDGRIKSTYTSYEHEHHNKFE